MLLLKRTRVRVARYHCRKTFVRTKNFFGEQIFSVAKNLETKNSECVNVLATVAYGELYHQYRSCAFLSCGRHGLTFLLV